MMNVGKLLSLIISVMLSNVKLQYLATQALHELVLHVQLPELPWAIGFQSSHPTPCVFSLNAFSKKHTYAVRVTALLTMRIQ